jgi:hypothetical protein
MKNNNGDEVRRSEAIDDIAGMEHLSTLFS